jgi:glucosamine 6-phosphate synthetase-like amidotransferase/phosphosugar isomerase protein
MCGIIASIHRSKEDNEFQKEFLLEQYDEQSHRGSRGFGLIEADEKGVLVHRSKSELKTVYDIMRAKKNMLVFHHRLPTSTTNEKDQTHPIYITNGELKHDWLVIHNGVISNANELRKIHENDLGYVYTTLQETVSQYTKAVLEKFNDTESFAIELVRFIEGRSDEINIDGSAAFIALRLNKKNKKPLELYWGTNGRNPLKYEEEDRHLTIASELPEGTHCIEDVLMSIKIHDINNPEKKTILESTNQSLLKFKEPAPVHATNYLSNATKTQHSTSVKTTYNTPAKTTTEQQSKKATLEYPEYVTTTAEKAVYKMVERRKEEIMDIFHQHFQQYIYQIQEDDFIDLEDEAMLHIEQKMRELSTKADRIIDYTMDEEERTKEEAKEEQRIIQRELDFI